MKRANKTAEENKAELDVTGNGARRASRGRPPKDATNQDAPAAKPKKTHDKSLEENKQAPKSKGAKKRGDSSPSKSPSPVKAKKANKSAIHQTEEFVPQPFNAKSAYNHFMAEKQVVLKTEDSKQADIFKKVGEMWSALDDKGKKPYEKMAEEDKTRQEKQKEMLAKKGYFKLEDGSKSNDPKNADLFKKQKADAAKKAKSNGEDVHDPTCYPKRALSAFMFFSKEKAAQIREKHTEASLGEVQKQVGELWSKCSEKDKKKYVDMHEADLKRQEKQKKEMQDKGFFVLEDGSKSTDEKNLVKPKRKTKKANATTIEDDAEEMSPPKQRKSAKEIAPAIAAAKADEKKAKKQK